jgi:hypothetical protein
MEEQKLRKRDTNLVVTFALVMGLITVGLYLTQYGATLNLDAIITSEYMALLPGVFIFTLGMIGIAISTGAFILPSCAAVGISLALLIRTLDDLGLITTAMLSGLTIEQTQTWIILICSLMGAILFALKRRN